MSRLLVVIVALVACKTDPPVHKPRTDPTPPSPFETLADETDSGVQKPIWPTLPENIRGDLERSAAAPADPAARLSAARTRLAHWSLDLDEARTEASDARLRAGLEGLYLVEPLAFGKPSPDTFAAIGLLQRFYSQLDRKKLAEWIATVPSLPVDRKLLELLGGAAPAMWGHFTAEVLRDGEPKEAVDAVLRDVAERRSAGSQHQSARDLYELFIKRRGAAATADDWLDVATAEIRMDDRAAATQALDAARALAARTPMDRRLASRMRGAERDFKDLVRYLAVRPKVNLDARLETLDLLRQLGRRTEARALVDELKKQNPKDARVRTRFAAMGFEDMMEASGNVLQGEAYVADELSDRTFVNQDGDYWSMLIGAQGVRAMADALPELQQNYTAGAQKMIEILTTTRDLTTELAKTRPGRAAALTFVLDRVIAVLAPGSTQDDAALGALKLGFADALPLRTQYPETAETGHLVYMLSMFYPDRAKAFAAVAAQPATPPDDDLELYLQRARAAVTLAIGNATPEVVATTRKLVEEIAPGWDPQTEAAREAMLGDCDAIEAAARPDPAAWARAAAHYEAARGLHKSVAQRMANNLGFIALQAGDKARATALFDEAAGPGSPRIWLAKLNAITATLDGAARLPAVRALVGASSSDGSPPIVLSVWLAALSTDPKEAAAAAKDALTETAFYAMKPNGSALGLEGEGVIEVGLGIASKKFFALNTKAYTNLWLTWPQPLGRAQLQALVKPVKPTKPKR